MDSSRTALRLGAKTSVVAYRRGPEEMVVDEEEQHETRFEGVRFEYFAAPVEILADENGHVKGRSSSARSSARRTRAVVGRRSPSPAASS